MDPRTSEPMTDADLDREIAAALDVEPTPPFAARVRQRVAEAPARSIRSRSWAVAAAIAAGLIVGVVVSKSGPSRSVRPSGLIASRPIGTISGGIPMLLPERALPGSMLARFRGANSDDSRDVVPSNHRRHAGGAITPPVKAEPEILISAAEARAIRNLIAGLRDGRIDPAMLPPQQPAAEITIPPIYIAPVTVAAVEGERQ
jgi:hypothetical protein